MAIEDLVLYCDACYATRGYGLCALHRHLWPITPAINAIRPAAGRPPTQHLTLYVERSKNSNWEKAEEIWLGGEGDRDEVRRAFSYALLETPVEVEVDLQTGRVRAHSFAGVRLERPTDWGL